MMFCKINKIFSLGIAFLLQLPLFAISPLDPVGLTCENLSNPINIDTKSPHFSWRFTSKEKNQVQSAYEIIVSDKLETINRAEGGVWQSGKVPSDQNVNISASVDLKPFTKYYWRVRVYNGENEVSGWSETASFETMTGAESGSEMDERIRPAMKTISRMTGCPYCAGNFRPASLLLPQDCIFPGSVIMKRISTDKR